MARADGTWWSEAARWPEPYRHHELAPVRVCDPAGVAVGYLADFALYFPGKGEAGDDRGGDAVVGDDGGPPCYCVFDEAAQFAAGLLEGEVSSHTGQLKESGKPRR